MRLAGFMKGTAIVSSSKNTMTFTYEAGMKFKF